MHRTSEQGIAHLAALLVILAGIIFGVILIKNPTFFFPKASEEPLTPSEEARKKSYAVHSFIFPNMSLENKVYLFDGVKRTNKKLVRFDFILSDIAPREGVFNFGKSDESISLAAGRGLQILGTIHQTPPWMVAPNQQRKFRGPIAEVKLPAYREAIKKVVSKYPKVVFWEIWNEPDLSYGGTTAEYARMLSVAYSAIKEANPLAQVLIGGVTTGALDNNWLQKVLTDPTYPAKNSYDVANIHIRASMSSLPNLTKKTLDVYRQFGKADAPLWVTEHGFPADKKLQAKKDPAYSDGEKSQADFYSKSLPLILDSGAAKVFVTLRDKSSEESNRSCSDNPFCWEGLLTFPSRESSAGRKDRLSMEVVAKLGGGSVATPTPSATSDASPRVTSTPKASASITPAGCSPNLTAGFNPENGQCREFRAPCEVPAHWRKIVGRGCPKARNTTSTPSPTPQPSVAATSGSARPTPIPTPDQTDDVDTYVTSTPQPSPRATAGTATPRLVSTPNPTSVFVGERQLTPFEVRPLETAVPFIRAPETPAPQAGPVVSIFTSIGGFFSIFFELLLSPFQF